MKIYKLKVVIERDNHSAFCDWYTSADNAISAIDGVQNLLYTTLPADTEITVNISADMVFKND